MPSINTIDTLLGGMTTGIWRTFSKNSPTPKAGSTYVSLWNAAGSPGAGSFAIGNTTTGVIPTSSTQGAVPFVNPTTTSYISNVGFQNIQLALGGLVATPVILYDRVWHAGSFSATSATNVDTTTSTALTRPDATGTDIEAWLEIVTVNAAVASVITLTFTDSAGNASQTATATFPASAVVGQMIPFNLGGSAYGVQAITNIANGTALASGTFNIVLARRLIECGPSSGTAYPIQDVDPFFGGLPQLPNNACIAGIMEAGNSVAATVSLRILLAQV